MSWNGNINTARESDDDNEELTEEYDGNYSYNNGTYGQNDYTVRERSDGTYDVYIESDSKNGHSHDRIDKDGNILNRYHDYLDSLLKQEELEEISSKTNEELTKTVHKMLIKK